ncbi:AAA family ATPase [Pseudonocardia sp. CA-107938]|uniref:AAA family ATPase n=1 Tax=Pseudonocardia sp. CA-107938 TaxID=3240021 RepID=UPI003D90FD4B
MRPVLLEMAGFAAFREPTTVDFAGADYFALVGATGSGKSTVIDALTFALYGSVPRWDNPRSVANALAPTAGRGAVRLVFDVGGERFVVARELRRAASGSVSVRGARLERLRDPSGTGAADEETEPLADGAGDTTAAVTALLGLTFADFCTCVVLPQGEFAEFLHAEPRKRQEKLVRLLGLDVYERIAKEANGEAAAQRQRAEVLTEQLGGYADATAEAEQAAADRVTVLDELAERVAAAVPVLTAAVAEQRAAAEQVTRLHEEGARLAAVRAPDGLAELGARRAAAVAAATDAAGAVARAEEADTAARAALAAEPARSRLERVLHDHRELAGALAELPGLQDRQAKAVAEYELAARDAGDALAAHDAARAAVEAAVAAHRVADERAHRLRAERTALRGLAAPAGLDALRGREAAAQREHALATSALAAAEQAEAQARAAVAQPRAVLDRARRDLAELATAEQAHTAAVAAVEQARRAADAAAEAVTAARHRRDHARAAHAEAVRSGLAATLRASLVAGEECPVCAQAVATLPPAAAVDADTESPLAAAEQEHEQAVAAEAAATAALARAESEVARQEAAADRLRAALADTGITTSAELAAAVAEAERVAAEQQRAAEAVRAARAAVTTAAAAVEDVRAASARAAAALRAARDPLVPFGAPGTGDDPLAGWTALLEWAATAAAEREAELPAAAAAAGAAEQERFTAEAALRTAERAARDRRTAETAAARAEQEARATVTAVERRIEVLRSALDGAPSPATAEAALARVTAAEKAAETADAELRAARRAQRIADTAAADVERAVATGWRVLRAARDPLVALGAPALEPDVELPDAWAALLSWADAARAERATRVVEAERAAADAATLVDGQAERLAAELAEHDVPFAGAGLAAEPARAITAVATEAARARAAHERIVERRAAVAGLVADRDRAEEAHRVAKLLGGLLRSDGFPRWLVASALDALVTDASASLAELSGGQFELTHDNGEFLVVDHADADSRRPVKTLSGGETFQASLALALALSAQMSHLAASGAARLESIFLDEGFGTLDESNLDVVASTLENLAAGGGRMVGVITHVPALAERVPVRFAVRRDQRTSSIERESV